MKKIILILTILGATVKMQAQQDPMLSHYMFNGLFLNPAYAGTHPYMGATLIHRQQWLGFNGRPQTSVFGIDGPLKSETMGLGFTFVNDRTGGFRRNDLMLNYAYHIKVNEGAKLSLGINAGLVNVGYNNGSTETWDDKSADVAFNNTTPFWTPKFGFGAYYYTSKFYAGLSIPALYANEPAKYSVSNSNDFNFFKTHYNLTAGYLFDVGSNIMLKPSTLIKYQRAAPLQLDLNCNAFFGEMFSAGLSYRVDRTGSWIVGLLGYNVTPELRLGMSYDYNISGIRKYNKGSLEFMLGYDFASKTMKIKNPRYF